MSAPSGLSAQLTLVEETVYGTYLAPTRALDFVSEGIKANRARLESKGLRAGRRVVTSAQWTSGARTISGPVTMELSQVGMGVIWRQLLGTIASSSAGQSGTYSYVATPGDMTGHSMTIQVGRPDITATVQPFSYTGCKLGKATLTAKAGDLATLLLDVVGQDESTAQSLVNASAMYPSTMQPVSFVQGWLLVGGVQVDIKEFQLQIDNKLDDKRLFLRQAATVKEPLETQWRDLMVDFKADFNGLSLYNTFVNAQETPLVLAFQGAQIGTRATADGATTNLSNVVTSATAAFTAADIGSQISAGSNLPAGTYIVSITNGTTVVVSNNATATGASLALNITSYYTTRIIMNVRYEGDTPNVPGPQILEQPIKAKGIANTASDSSAITVQYVTTDTAY